MEKCPTVCNQDMGKCFDLESAISCHSLMSTIISNCNSHPNELLACNDARLPQYPSILKNGQIKAEAETEAEYKKAQADNQTRLKFEKCMEEGGTINACKLKITQQVISHSKAKRLSNGFLTIQLL